MNTYYLQPLLATVYINCGEKGVFFLFYYFGQSIVITKLRCTLLRNGPCIMRADGSWVE